MAGLGLARSARASQAYEPRMSTTSERVSCGGDESDLLSWLSLGFHPSPAHVVWVAGFVQNRSKEGGLLLIGFGSKGQLHLSQYSLHDFWGASHRATTHGPRTERLHRTEQIASCVTAGKHMLQAPPSLQPRQAPQCGCLSRLTTRSLAVRLSSHLRLVRAAPRPRLSGSQGRHGECAMTMTSESAKSKCRDSPGAKCAAECQIIQIRSWKGL